MENYVSAGQVTATGYTMIAITSAVVITRFSLLFWKSRSLQIEDGWVAFSYISFLAMSIAYIVVTPAMYRVTGFEEGKIPYYATLVDDALFMIKIFFANTLLLWVALWSVKLAFLFLYRRLLQGVPNQMKWWWMVLVFTVLAFIGCVISNFTSCSSMRAWFTVGSCNTHRDAVAEIASLYFSFAVDVISDIMIMLLPLRLVFSLHLPLHQKLSLVGVFTMGIICIIMAIVRVVQIGARDHGSSTPSSSWLALWGMIEAGIAVIVGCLPAFAIIYRRAKNSKRYPTGYPDLPLSGYIRQDEHGISKISISGTRTDSETEPLGGRTADSKPMVFVTRSVQLEEMRLA